MKVKGKWLAPKLKHRISIQEPVQIPNNETGGFDITYKTLTTIWAGLKEISFANFGFVMLIRGEQTGEIETHEFMVRYSAVKNLGKSFVSAFSTGFDSISNINPVKSEYFIELHDGTNVSRLFRIKRIKRDDNYKAYIYIKCTEIEEHGTGWPS